MRLLRSFKLIRSILFLCFLSVLLMKKSENLLLDSLILLMYPPLVPRLLPVQDQQEVLKLRKTKLLPLYLARIIFLNIIDGLQVILLGSRPTWRTNFLPSPPPVLPHNTASTKGFSSSCSLLSLNRDKDLLRGKLKEIFSFFLVKRIHTCHPCNRPASHTGHTYAGCQPHGTFEAELWSHPVKVAWRHCLLLMRGCMGVNTQLVVNNWLIDLCCGLTCDV